MRYQISDKIILSADKYATNSLNYTHDWDGFKNDKSNAKHKRIKTGKVAEYWTAEYCHKNNISYKLDMTNYTQSDDEDIIINNIKVDCKSTSFMPCAGQVQPSHDTKNKKDTRNEYYCFYYVDLIAKEIEPFGFMEKEWLIESSDKVMKGEKIRGWIVQKHDPYSYFISNFDSLINFEEHIRKLR